MTPSQHSADVQLASAGDADALQRLILHYHAPLRAAVAAAVVADLRTRIDPVDVLQEAYTAAFKTLSGRAADQNRDREGAGSVRATDDSQRPPPRPPHFDSPAGFYKWLEAIALARLKDQQRALRRQKRDVAREARPAANLSDSCHDVFRSIAGDQSTPSRHVAKEEAVAAVMTSLARLSDDQRAVIRLRFLESRPVAEVARRLGKSEAAIHMLCHRGLRALREHMVSITRYLTHL